MQIFYKDFIQTLTTQQTLCEQHTHVSIRKRRYYLSHLETSTNNTRNNTVK
jgi:hypothetical protein